MLKILSTIFACATPVTIESLIFRYHKSTYTVIVHYGVSALALDLAALWVSAFVPLNSFSMNAYVLALF